MSRQRTTHSFGVTSCLQYFLCNFINFSLDEERKIHSMITLG